VVYLLFFLVCDLFSVLYWKDIKWYGCIYIMSEIVFECTLYMMMMTMTNYRKYYYSTNTPIN